MAGKTAKTNAFAKAEARAKKTAKSKAALDKATLAAAPRKTNERAVVHKKASVRQRTYPEEFAHLDTLPKILRCQCRKILDDRGHLVEVPRAECTCEARNWNRTCLHIDVDALQMLEDLRDAEERIVGVRMPLQSYMLAAFRAFLPTREEGIEYAAALQQHMDPGEKPESPKTLGREMRWPHDVAQACRHEARRVYASGRGKGQVMVPASWYYSTAIRKFVDDRLQLLKA